MKSLLALAFLATAALGQPRDIFDYTGQNNAPAGTKWLVFISAKGTQGNTRLKFNGNRDNNQP